MLKNKSISLLLAVFMLIGTLQIMPVLAADESGQTSGLVSYTWDFDSNTAGDGIDKITDISNDATDEKGKKQNDVMSKFEVVNDASAGGNVLQWTAKTVAEKMARENLYFELPNAIKTADGPFKITMKYKVNDYPKRVDGTCSFMGKDSNGADAKLNFGLMNWLNKEQEKYFKLYVNNSMWYTNSNMPSVNNGRFVQIDTNNNKNKYIIYEYTVDPATKTFRARNLPDGYTEWQEPYKDYTLPTGDLPAEINKLRFSIYENWATSDNTTTSFDTTSTYTIAYVKIEQTNLEVESTTPASGELFTGNTASVVFNTTLDATTVNENTVKVTKNDEELLYGTDYTASVDSADSKKINILFAKSAANNEKYTVCITKGVNNKPGYPKMNSDYTFNLVTNHTYINYTFDFNDLAEKAYADKANITDIKNFSTNTKYADFSIVNDTTIGKKVLQWDWDGNQDLELTSNGKRTNGTEDLYFELPEPIKPANGKFTITMSYKVPKENGLRSQDGTASFIGTKDGAAKTTYFGTGSYNNSGQEKFEKLYYEGNLYKASEKVVWKSSDNKDRKLFMEKYDSNRGVYINYKFVVDPASGTYRAYWQREGSTYWEEPYANSIAYTDSTTGEVIKYPFKVGEMPDVINKLRFSLYQTFNTTDESIINETKARSSTYYMNYVKVEQNPLAVESLEKTYADDGKTILNVNFTEAIDDTTVENAVKLYKNGKALAYGTDYTVTFIDDDNKIMKIALAADAADTDNIGLVIEDTINSNEGYSKLLSTYKYNTKNSVEFTAVSYKNSNGTSIDTPDKITDGTLNVNATVLNNSGASLTESVILIEVFDSEHKLITCSLNDLNDSLANGKSKDINKTFTNLGDDVKSVELFVFNNMNEIIPITSAYSSKN